MASLPGLGLPTAPRDRATKLSREISELAAKIKSEHLYRCHVHKGNSVDYDGRSQRLKEEMDSLLTQIEIKADALKNLVSQ